MDLADIGQLSDGELFDLCKSNGINVGPIGPTTRKLYDKKLFKVLQDKAVDGATDAEKLSVGNDMSIPLQRKSISQYLGLDETPKSYSRPAPNLNYMDVDTPVTHHSRQVGGGDANDDMGDGEGSENSFQLDLKLTDNESDNENVAQATASRPELSSSAYMSVTRSGVLKRRPLHRPVLDDSAFETAESNSSAPEMTQDTEYETASLISTKVKLFIVIAVVIFMYLVFESMEPEPSTPELN